MALLVARPIDTVPEKPGETFRVRVLTVCQTEAAAIDDARKRELKGQSVVVVTAHFRDNVQTRQVVQATVGTGKPMSPRYTA